ncbi:hypothetical protein Riv7116_6897 [Rivularia sp. PCC 7116]|nr:hypothetical protein Riv7116_6897 [Rivularia sp. PCC 7116]
MLYIYYLSLLFIHHIKGIDISRKHLNALNLHLNLMPSSSLFPNQNLSFSTREVKFLNLSSFPQEIHCSCFTTELVT